MLVCVDELHLDGNKRIYIADLFMEYADVHDCEFFKLPVDPHFKLIIWTFK